MMMEQTNYSEPTIQFQNPNHITYQTILNGFAQNEGNSFSQKHLQRLSDFSKTIDEPLVYGAFNSEKHYLNTLKLVLDSTNETSNRINFFQKKVLPSIKKSRRFLDIGPGDCALTKAIASDFEHITAVDLNQHILNELENHLPDEIEFKKIASCVSSAVLDAGYYDFAV